MHSGATFNSITTTRYVLDPAAGLTQVLADGTNTYLYGNDRLAQYQAAMQYFGADGLGSVRQIIDASAVVVGSSRYDPYGNVMSQSGTATSVFAFAGEQQDATGLTYLRARYYSSAQGRFTTRDVWEGDPNAPMSYNAWNYTNGNPVNYTDRTGRFIDESDITKDPPGAEYSCNCGWIDWTHVGDFSGYSLLSNLTYARDNYRPDKAGTDKWLFYHPISVHAGPVSLDLFNGFALVPNRSLTSGDNIPKLGLSIFMDANEQFEQQQGDVGARLFLPKLQSSWFSEEDLPSDLMGFYGGLQKFGNPNLSPEQFKEQIRQVCGAVGKEASLTVFRDTYKGGALALRGWKNWYPRLVPLAGGCSSGLCSGRRAWPAQFSALTDLRIRPEENGVWWWWWSAHPDDVVVPTDRQGVFRLSEHK